MARVISFVTQHYRADGVAREIVGYQSSMRATCSVRHPKGWAQARSKIRIGIYRTAKASYAINRQPDMPDTSVRLLMTFPLRNEGNRLGVTWRSGWFRMRQKDWLRDLKISPNKRCRNRRISDERVSPALIRVRMVAKFKPLSVETTQQ